MPLLLPRLLSTPHHQLRLPHKPLKMLLIQQLLRHHLLQKLSFQLLVPVRMRQMLVT
jgi:hypothetical protein